MGFWDRQKLIGKLGDETANLDIVAKHIKDGMRDNFGFSGGGMTDAQIMQAGYGYNRGYDNKAIDRTSPAPNRFGPSAWAAFFVGAELGGGVALLSMM
ncbi:MAG: hypothetical protein HQL44_12950 [Alphaproteobacteria bacterium]|nr:hypothetical protein [Alphaproteobacteria bacterium]